jgi:hypothetical protein
VLIPDEIGAATAHARRKPVVDSIINRVKRTVGAINRDTRGGTAQQGGLERVRQGYGGEWFEDGWMIRDDY